ncbi:MAG TPA: hypothetical protein VF324_02950 [Methanobacterium sp.]
MSDVKYKFEIENVNDIILLDMKEQVEKAFKKTFPDIVGEINEMDIEELKIYKETLNSLTIRNSPNYISIKYLINKINYILNIIGEEE